eukprot:356213-Chlamydomonas_euryale.AAC.1
MSPCRAGEGWFCVQHGKTVPVTAPPKAVGVGLLWSVCSPRLERVCRDDVWLLALLSLRALASYASGRRV